MTPLALWRWLVRGDRAWLSNADADRLIEQAEIQQAVITDLDSEIRRLRVQLLMAADVIDLTLDTPGVDLRTAHWKKLRIVSQAARAAAREAA